MRCSDVRDLLHCFLDGELEVDRNVAILKHLELCARCNARAVGERRLREAVESAALERVSPEDQRQIFDAVYAEAEAAPPRKPRRRLALLLLAAGLLLATGLTFLAVDPFCWRGCPTLAAARDAYMAVLTREPIPAGQLTAQGDAPPVCAGLDCVGGLEAADALGCTTLLRYRCPEGRDMVYLRLKSGHLHSEYVRLLEDGRPYMEVAMQGMRVIAWEDGPGVTFCMSAESVPRERLTAMARELRAGHG